MSFEAREEMIDMMIEVVRDIIHDIIRDLVREVLRGHFHDQGKFRATSSTISPKRTVRLQSNGLRLSALYESPVL